MAHEKKAEALCQIRDCSCLVHPSCEGTKVELARLRAEVAVLLNALEEAAALANIPVAVDVPSQARALLTRLEAAERVAQAAQEFLASGGDGSRLVDLDAVCSAWQESKNG